ncbi:MAG: beta-aspartyl-peptidase [Thermotogota bacterium]
MGRFKLFKNLQIYTPEEIGNKDILLYADKIVMIADSIEAPFPQDTDIEDYSGCIGFPGFIDGHVHIIGGGGEGGFFTRTTPQSELDFFKSGTTTVIGLLGTDGITRTHRELLGQARKFTHNKLKTFLVTGSYALPLVTLLNNLQEDMVFVPEYIGIGEIAISDHRSSGITIDEFRRILLNARVAGMLSGKVGKAIIHVGAVKTGLELLREAVSIGDISSHQLLPTHINRTPQTLAEGKDWILNFGGSVDFTAGEKAVDGISSFIEDNVPIENILCSSDGWGSIPIFDKKGDFVSVKTAPVDTLYEVFKTLVLEKGHAIQDCLKIFTSNVSDFFGISKEGYGHLFEGGVANFTIVDQHLDIRITVSQGEIVFKN